MVCWLTDFFFFLNITIVASQLICNSWCKIIYRFTTEFFISCKSLQFFWEEQRFTGFSIAWQRYNILISMVKSYGFDYNVASLRNCMSLKPKHRKIIQPSGVEINSLKKAWGMKLIIVSSMLLFLQNKELCISRHEIILILFFGSGYPTCVIYKN